MFRCKKCKGESAPTGSLNFTQVHPGEDTVEAVPTFQYFGDVIGESDDCVDATSACITTAWKIFRPIEKLPVITNCGISLKKYGNIFSSCIRKSLLYGCETLSSIQRNNTSFKIFGQWYVSLDLWCLEQRIRTQELYEKLGIISVTEEIRWRMLRYLSHLPREWIRMFGQEE